MILGISLCSLMMASEMRGNKKGGEAIVERVDLVAGILDVCM